MTDEQIIKGFECCIHGKEGFGKVLDLIKRQQAEIERYQKNEVEVMEKCNQMLVQLGELRECIAFDIIKAKKEAYKEFAERLNKNFETYTDDEEKNALYMRNLINNLVKELTEVNNGE